MDHADICAKSINGCSPEIWWWRLTPTPRASSASFAASFLAAFFVVAFPFPKQRWSIIARTAHIGVVFPWLTSDSVHTHSTYLPLCWRYWLNKLRWPVVTPRSAGSNVGGRLWERLGGANAEENGEVDINDGVGRASARKPYSLRIMR